MLFLKSIHITDHVLTKQASASNNRAQQSQSVVMEKTMKGHENYMASSRRFTWFILDINKTIPV